MSAILDATGRESMLHGDGGVMMSQRNVMIGVKDDQIVYVPIAKAIKMDKPIGEELINVLETLSI